MTAMQPEDDVHTNPSRPQAASAKVVQLLPPSRWHDPLRLIQEEPPKRIGRIVLWSVSVLVVVLFMWAAVGQLDIIASAEGKLVPQTLVKIVQPAEAGVVKQLLVNEGELVKAGQILARLDPTIALADKASVAGDLQIQHMQLRRIEAELTDQPMLPKKGDDLVLFAQVQSQFIARRRAWLDSLDQEQALLSKVEHERKSAAEILAKLEQTLPTYRRSADAFAKLEVDGFIGGLAAAEKQREAIEKARDRDAQRATVLAFEATIAAQKKRISQLQNTYKSELQKDLTEVKIRVAQLQPTLDKTIFKEGLMELKAPQDGVIKDLATTTVGAVVQPGSVIMTLVPQGERLFADVSIKNDDVGFVQIGQIAQIKLAAYPFQKYGMLAGRVTHVSPDATELSRQSQLSAAENYREGSSSTAISTYKARIQLDAQELTSPQRATLALTAGMQVVAEINQGKRSVLEYLLSPLQKAVQEAGRER